MEFVKEIFQFMMVRKKFWLIPLLLSFVLIGGLLFVSSGTVVSPLIYTLF